MCTQISDDVMPSEIVCFHALRPLPSAFCAILESSFAALKLNIYFGLLLQLSSCSFLGMEGELTHIL